MYPSFDPALAAGAVLIVGLVLISFGKWMLDQRADEENDALLARASLPRPVLMLPAPSEAPVQKMAA